jgi:hypothetical protein
LRRDHAIALLSVKPRPFCIAAVVSTSCPIALPQRQTSPALAMMPRFAIAFSKNVPVVARRFPVAPCALVAARSASIVAPTTTSSSMRPASAAAQAAPSSTPSADDAAVLAGVAESRR